MSRAKKWHPSFVEYAEFIINHPNYTGLPETRKKDLSIKWVSTAKGDKGAREKWWKDKKKEIINSKQKILTRINNKILPSDVAYHIHPTKIKVCSECGKKVKIGYYYPNKRLIDKLNNLFPNKNYKQNYDFDILDIVDEIYKNNKNEIYKLEQIFLKIKKKIKFTQIKKTLINVYINKFDKSFLTPGAMSNCPDRLDGFHTYAVCCRSTADKGRSKENLNTYSEDRRLFEFWSDGDWKAAQYVMGQFKNHGMSADHIGPISLGFCHRPRFQPMSSQQNSAKGNRMSFKDVQILITHEDEGDVVVSWHTRPMWDNIKNKIKNDEDAKRASKLLKLNMEMILNIFYELKKNGMEKFLISYLNPNFAFYQHKLIKFDLNTGKTKIKKIKTNRNENRTNASRYIKKSLESLESIIIKNNRKNQKLINKLNLDQSANLIKKIYFTKGIVDAKKTCLDQITNNSKILLKNNF